MDVLKHIDKSDYCALINCDNWRHIDHEMKNFLDKIPKSIIYRVDRVGRRILFISGAKIYFSSIQTKEDVHRWAGIEFQYIKRLPGGYAGDYLLARLRSSNPEITPEWEWN